MKKQAFASRRKSDAEVAEATRQWRGTLAQIDRMDFPVIFSLDHCVGVNEQPKIGQTESQLEEVLQNVRLGGAPFAFTGQFEASGVTPIVFPFTGTIECRFCIHPNDVEHPLATEFPMIESG